MTQLTLSDKMRELRENASYTQAAVSRKLNIQRQTYCNYENALRNPPIEIIVALAELYHVSVDYLVRSDAGTENTAAAGSPNPAVGAPPVKAPDPAARHKAEAPSFPMAQKLLGEFSSLPENAQKEVLNFIQFKKLFSD